MAALLPPQSKMIGVVRRPELSNARRSLIALLRLDHSARPRMNIVQRSDDLPGEAILILDVMRMG